MLVGKRSSLLAVAFALLAGPAVAGTDYTTTRVIYVRVYADSSRLTLTFEGDVTSGCDHNDKIDINASYTSAETREHIHQVALAARLSGGLVEVAALNGSANCIPEESIPSHTTGGRLVYLNLKED